MVEQSNELIIQSEESQTVFEGEQALIQPPPKQNKQNQPKKKIMLIGGLAFIVFLVLFAAATSVSRNQNFEPQKPTPLPSPTPIYIDPVKENELKRVENIIENSNPKNLLIVPPQVDMNVSF